MLTSLKLNDHLDLNWNGKKIPFEFPLQGNTRDQVIKVLDGREYPLIPLPGYQPKTILDIGAHIGATSLYFCNEYPTAQLYAFEPSQQNYQYLAKNTANHSNIHPLQYGLFSENREVPLYLGVSQGLQHSISRNPETTMFTETIQLKCIQEALDAENIQTISILKVDTEGCEVPILQALADRLPQIDIIYVEYHSEEDRLEIDRLLTPHFYLCAAISQYIHRGMLAYLSKDIAKQNQMDTLFIKRPE